MVRVDDRLMRLDAFRTNKSKGGRGYPDLYIYIYIYIYPSRKLTYPTLRKLKSSSKVPIGDMLAPCRAHIYIYIYVYYII